MKINLKNKNIIITGASSGLGRELSCRLDKMGCKISLIGRNKKRLEQTFDMMKNKKNHTKFLIDFSNTKNIKKYYKKIFNNEKYDGFVNCAGYYSFGPLQSLNENEIIKSFNVNSIAPFLLIKEFSKTNNYNINASIILVSSVAASTGSSFLTLYSSTKSVQNTISMSFASELSKKKIRINSISASMLESEIYNNLKSLLPNENFDDLNKKHLLGIGKYEYLIDSIVFYLSDKTKWITGTNVVCDGGYSLK